MRLVLPLTIKQLPKETICHVMSVSVPLLATFIALGGAGGFRDFKCCAPLHQSLEINSEAELS